MRRFIALPFAVVVACAPKGPPGEARFVPVPPMAAQSAAVPAIDSYDGALAAIADVFARDLGLPRPEVTLVLFPDRRAFEEGLRTLGYEPQFAQDTASTFNAIGGARAILVNERSLRHAGWPERVRVLAHELVHSVQYALGGGVRGASEQWLREGFAELVSMETVERLGLGRARTLRDDLLSPLSRVSAAQDPAPLTQLSTFRQWGAAQTRFRVPLYAQALLATELLVERHGRRAVVDYFSRFAASQEPEAHFAAAFGLTLRHFEDRFRARWVAYLAGVGSRFSGS